MYLAAWSAARLLTPLVGVDGLVQVLGHFKLLVILTAGIFLFNEDTNSVRLLGMCLAFIGIVAYTTLKQSTASGWEKTPKAEAVLPESDREPLRKSVQ